MFPLCLFLESDEQSVFSISGLGIFWSLKWVILWEQFSIQYHIAPLILSRWIKRHDFSSKANKMILILCHEEQIVCSKLYCWETVFTSSVIIPTLLLKSVYFLLGNIYLSKYCLFLFAEYDLFANAIASQFVDHNIIFFFSKYELGIGFWS